jgi:hypothetical protein
MEVGALREMTERKVRERLVVLIQETSQAKTHEEIERCRGDMNSCLIELAYKKGVQVGLSQAAAQAGRLIP